VKSKKLKYHFFQRKPLFFTVLHLSNIWIVTKQKKEPSFLRRRMVGVGRPFYLQFWVKLTLLE